MQMIPSLLKKMLLPWRRKKKKKKKEIWKKLEKIGKKFQTDRYFFSFLLFSFFSPSFFLFLSPPPSWLQKGMAPKIFERTIHGEGHTAIAYSPDGRSEQLRFHHFFFFLILLLLPFTTAGWLSPEELTSTFVSLTPVMDRKILPPLNTAPMQSTA